MLYRRISQALCGYFALLCNAQPAPSSGCRCFPGEPCWPSAESWSRLNRTVGGRLVATVPIGAPCHDSSFGPFDAERCAQVQSAWGFPQTHIETSSSIMTDFFANSSCDPFAPREAQCVVGTYVQYAVDARSAADYQAAIKFAREKNIRLLVRNTGHDYFGKSTGAGALAIWTQHLKSIDIIDYQSTAYTGPAIRVGAGVQNQEAQQFAHDHGYVAVGGNGRTVGYAGGYTQGGGHGPLATKYGLAADQVLEWEVVTADGQLRTASPSRNQDLYWALTGGGGGTYGAVVSMTARIYRDSPMSAANLTIVNDGSEDFYSVFQTFLQTLPSILETGASCIWLLLPNVLLVQPVIAPDVPQSELQSLMDPLLAAINETGVQSEYFIGSFPDYLTGFDAMSPPPNVTEANLGGRLIPRSAVEDDASAARLVEALRFIVEDNGVVSGVSVTPRAGAEVASNSVNPVWRETLFSAVVGNTYSRTDDAANVDGQRRITDNYIPRLEELTPGGAVYLNEGDFNQPNFQEAFYGVNYRRLREIKNRYDRHHMWYGLTAVGSEDWQVDARGRLCRTH